MEFPDIKISQNLTIDNEFRPIRNIIVSFQLEPAKDMACIDVDNITKFNDLMVEKFKKYITESV
jgi:hypothetical protein